MTVSNQPVVEEANWIFNFYKLLSEVDIEWNPVQIKKFCKSKTVAWVNIEIAKLQERKLKIIEEHNVKISNIDEQIAKQQHFLSLMV